MVIHNCNPNTRDADAFGYFQASTVYTVSSRTSRNTYGDPVLNIIKSKNLTRKCMTHEPEH